MQNASSLLGDGSYDPISAVDSSTERLIMHELEKTKGVETMLSEQLMNAERYKANFNLLETQHIALQQETETLQNELQRGKSENKSQSRRFEASIMKLEGDKEALLLEIEGLKTKIMTPAKLENLRQNLLKDVEQIYKQHLNSTEEEVEAYRKELNKLKFDHNFLKTEYENTQNEFSHKVEDLHSKYKLELDTLSRRNNAMRKTLEQKGLAAEESVVLMKDNTILQAKLKSMSAENESLRRQIANEVKKGDDKVANISLKLSQLTVKQELTETENNSLQIRMEKIQAKMEKCNNDMAAQIPHISKLEEQNMRYLADIEDLKHRQKMDIATAEKDSKRQIAELQKTNDDLTMQLNDHNTKTEFTNRTTEQLKNMLKQKEKEHADKIQQLKDHEWECLNRAQQEKSQVDIKIAAKEKVHSDELHAINIDLEKLRNSVDHLTQQNHTLEKEHDKLMVECGTLRSNAASKDKELNQLQRIEHDVHDLESKLKASQNQYKDEIIENDKVKAQNKLANEEVMSLRNQIRDMKMEFEKVCSTNQSNWEKENEELKDKYTTLKKRLSKGEKRRQTILALAKKQKSEHAHSVSALKDQIIQCQAKEKALEIEKEGIKRNHAAQTEKMRRQIGGFKLKAKEFENLLYNPLGSEPSPRGGDSMCPDAFSTIMEGEKQQRHEIAELQKNLNDFAEKQDELNKVL